MAADILYLLSTLLDLPRSICSVIFISVQNLVEIRAVISVIFHVFYWLENAYSRPRRPVRKYHKIGFRGFDPVMGSRVNATPKLHLLGIGIEIVTNSPSLQNAQRR